MCKSRIHTPNEGKIIDTTRVRVIGISMYDTIAPPKLTVDSTKLYQEIGELLKFTSRLKYYEDETRQAGYMFEVGINGHVEQTNTQRTVTRIASEDIEADMTKVINFIRANLTEWQPAFLKSSPSEKIPYLVEISFYFYEDKIQFTVEGAQSYSFLRKSYDPNYSNR
jgi:hypothetical protein